MGEWGDWCRMREANDERCRSTEPSNKERTMDPHERLEAIQEAVDYALAYVSRHGKAGWSYDMMREALVKIDGLTALSNGWAVNMQDDQYDDAGERDLPADA